MVDPAPTSAQTRVEIPSPHLVEPLPRLASDAAEVDPLALHLLRDGVLAADALAASPEVRRQVGRAMAGPAAEHGAIRMLQAFASLRMGEIHLVDGSPGRYVFESADLQSAATSSRQAACHLAVGFLEGVVEASSGGLALGSEVACRARGDAACRFVVRATTAL